METLWMLFSRCNFVCGAAKCRAMIIIGRKQGRVDICAYICIYGYVQLCRLGSAVCSEALLGALQFVHSVHQGAAFSSYDHSQPTCLLGSSASA